ncbi:MAG: phosphatidate cytidylyltransferase [Deltaproteobacteria bacterium]|nr:phosphatidate cytidylyltransferase [Deltaproteobacteria bacterium]
MAKAPVQKAKTAKKSAAGKTSTQGKSSVKAPAAKSAAGPKKTSGKFQAASLPTRLASGVPAVLAVAALLAWAPLDLGKLVVLVLAVWGAHEYQQMMAGRGLELPRWFFLGGAALMGLGGMAWGWLGLAGLLFIAIHMMMTPILLSVKDRNEVKRRWKVGWLGLILVPFAINHLSLVLGYVPPLGPTASGELLPTDGTQASIETGRWALAFLVAVISLSDTLAYFTGILIGKTPLMPSVSPKKTVEGSLGGIAGGVLAAVGFQAMGWVTPGFEGAMALVAGGAFSLLGQAGDLTESKIKRFCGVKDSGRFLPGHGGVLDRLDAYLLAAPAYAWWLLMA